LPVRIPGEHRYAPWIGRVAEARQRHRETTLVAFRPPLVSNLLQMGQLGQPQVAMAADGQGVTGPLDTFDRSSYRRHRRTGESERLDLDDRLVADLHCLQSGRDIRRSPGLARRQGGREPAELAGLGNPSFD